MKGPEIISGCIQKEPIAQRHLFARYYRRSFYVAMRYLANHHDTEDVLSISFTRILKNIGQFEYRAKEGWTLKVKNFPDPCKQMRKSKQLYFNGFFQQVSPGFRIGIGL